ncbi:hypothetical protein AAMO2058_000951900 [Amorphochlora amoebiformis]|eukprot:158792-Amorphochlora_amoeboformis.AAC.2
MASTDFDELAKSLSELERTVKVFSVRFQEIAEVNNSTMKLGGLFSSMFQGVKSSQVSIKDDRKSGTYEGEK